MERLKKAEDQPRKPRWLNKSGGLRLKNLRYIKPGQTFEADVEDIPKAFRDMVVPLDPIVEQDAAKEKEIEEIGNNAGGYTTQSRGKSTLWYDVVDSNGKVVNEKALNKAAAEEMLKSYGG